MQGALRSNAADGALSAAWENGGSVVPEKRDSTRSLFKALVGWSGKGFALQLNHDSVNGFGGKDVARLSTRGLVAIAMALSLLTAFLVYGYLNNLANRTAKAGQPVIVAKKDIAAKTRITADMVEETLVPAEYIQPGAMKETGQMIGVIAREHISANEQITPRLLVLGNKTAGFSGMIPGGKRAVTVAVSEVTGVAGFVKAGDRVDVVITFDQSAVGDNAAKLVLQNVQVLAANQDAEGAGTDTAASKKDATRARVVTLAVTPQEAAQVTLGEEKGKLRLALRPYTASEEIVAVNTVTPKDMVGEQTAPARSGVESASAPAAPQAAPAPAGRSGGSSFGIQVIRGTSVADK
jgi:pilus assembly protein CpaB